MAAPPPSAVASAAPSPAPSKEDGDCDCSPPPDDAYQRQVSCGARIAPSEAATVLRALFPVHLESLRDCAKHASEPGTWVEVDARQAENYAAGQFVPRVVERTSLTATWRGDASPSANRYAIVVDNCQPNTHDHVVYATFVREELTSAHAKPVYRCECHPAGSALVRRSPCG